MNVLLTSIGRRAYLVKFFKEAVGRNGTVHICNSDDKSVAFLYADKSVVSPLINSNEYIPFLLNYCKSNKINILVSLFDLDLSVLAKYKGDFLEIGTILVISDSDFISTCNDKWKTYLYLLNNGFNVPKTFLTIDDIFQGLNDGVVNYPIVVKPRFGCGSIGISIAHNEMGLLYFYRSIQIAIKNSYLKYESSQVQPSKMILYQEFINGQEYGADIINDLDGHYRNIILRKKIAMRAGETDIAEISEEPTSRETLIRLGKMTGHIGNLDVDMILKDNKPYILELNARFGGGYPFSHMAGCDLPKAIINWANGFDVPDTMISAQKGFKGYKEIFIVSNS